MHDDFAHRAGWSRWDAIGAFANVGILLLVLIPSLPGPREAGKRTQCLNNLHQLGLAIAWFEGTNRRYPGYKETLRFDQPLTVGGRSYRTWPVSWVVAILPGLERNDLSLLWKEGGDRSFLATGANSPLRPLEVLACPESPPPDSSGQWVAYAVNAGQADGFATADSPADRPGNGVFFNRFCDAEGLWGRKVNAFENQIVTMTTDRIVDGLSTTIMMGERGNNNLGWSYAPWEPWSLEPDPYAEPQLGILWWANSPDARIPATDLWRPNGDGPLLDGQSELAGAGVNFARPASRHRGGANYIFCGGNARFIANSIDYGVYCQIMSSHGAETGPPAGSPSGGVNAKTFAKDGYKYFRESKVDEDDIQ